MDFPSGPEGDSLLPMQGGQVLSLLEEVRSHTQCNVAGKEKENNR